MNKFWWCIGISLEFGLNYKTLSTFQGYQNNRDWSSSTNVCLRHLNCITSGRSLLSDSWSCWALHVYTAFNHFRAYCGASLSIKGFLNFSTACHVIQIKNSCCFEVETCLKAMKTCYLKKPLAMSNRMLRENTILCQSWNIWLFRIRDFSISFLFWFTVLFSLVWSGRGPIRKRGCHILPWANQDLATFESESDDTVNQIWSKHT